MEEMSVKGIAAYALSLLVKSGVIDREEMEKAQEDVAYGIPELLRKTNEKLDEAQVELNKIHNPPQKS